MSTGAPATPDRRSSGARVLFHVHEDWRFTAVDHIVRHTPQSDRERLLGLVTKVRVTRFETFKTEALPQDEEPFAWIDDSPTGAELDWLRARGWLERWLWIDTREEPEDLLRAKRWLEERLELAAEAEAGA